MDKNDKISVVKTIPIPQYFLEAVPEIAPGLSGTDFDLYGSKPVCLCPFHMENTPSFRWFENTNTCYCFGCGIGGDIIKIHRKIMEANREMRISFEEAVNYLYNRFIEGNNIKLMKKLQNTQTSKADVHVFEHTILRRASNVELAEDLSLLIKLGKITGMQAIEFYQSLQSRI